LELTDVFLAVADILVGSATLGSLEILAMESEDKRVSVYFDISTLS
jgi:hypothetical protein